MQVAGGRCRRRVGEPSEAADTKLDAGQRGCGAIGAFRIGDDDLGDAPADAGVP